MGGSGSTGINGSCANSGSRGRKDRDAVMLVLVVVGNGISCK